MNTREQSKRSLSIGEFYSYVFEEIKNLKQGSEDQKIKKKKHIKNKFDFILHDEMLTDKLLGFLNAVNAKELKDILFNNQTQEPRLDIHQNMRFPADEEINQYFEQINNQYKYFNLSHPHEKKAIIENYIKYFKAAKLVEEFIELNRDKNAIVHDSHEKATMQAYTMLGIIGVPNKNEATFKKIENYIIMRANNETKNLLADAFNIKLPVNQPPLKDLKCWQSLILNNKRGIDYFLKAHQIEEKLGRTPEDIDEARVGLAKLRFTNYEAFPELANLIVQFDSKNEYKEEYFNECIALRQIQKESDNLPNVIVNGKDINQPGYFLVKLPRDDPRAYILGLITLCCQIVGDNGEEVVRSGITLANCGFYVLLQSSNKNLTTPFKHDKIDYVNFNIIGQAYAWLSQQGNFTFDSWENTRISDDALAVLMLQQFAAQLNELMPDALRVTIGLGGKTPAIFEKNRLFNLEHIKEGAVYDAKSSQAVVGQTKKMQELLDELSLHLTKHHHTDDVASMINFIKTYHLISTINDFDFIKNKTLNKSFNVTDLLIMMLDNHELAAAVNVNSKNFIEHLLNINDFDKKIELLDILFKHLAKIRYSDFFEEMIKITLPLNIFSKLLIRHQQELNIEYKTEEELFLFFIKNFPSLEKINFDTSDPDFGNYISKEKERRSDMIEGYLLKLFSEIRHKYPSSENEIKDFIELKKQSYNEVAGDSISGSLVLYVNQFLNNHILWWAIQNQAAIQEIEKMLDNHEAAAAVDKNSKKFIEYILNKSDIDEKTELLDVFFKYLAKNDHTDIFEEIIKVKLPLDIFRNLLNLHQKELFNANKSEQSTDIVAWFLQHYRYLEKINFDTHDAEFKNYINAEIERRSGIIEEKLHNLFSAILDQYPGGVNEVNRFIEIKSREYNQVIGTSLSESLLLDVKEFLNHLLYTAISQYPKHVDLDIIKLIMESGADINDLGQSKKSPLELSLKNLCISYGFKKNIEEYEDLFTYLLKNFKKIESIEPKNNYPTVQDFIKQEKERRSQLIQESILAQLNDTIIKYPNVRSDIDQFIENNRHYYADVYGNSLSQLMLKEIKIFKNSHLISWAIQGNETIENIKEMCHNQDIMMYIDSKKLIDIILNESNLARKTQLLDLIFNHLVKINHTTYLDEIIKMKLPADVFNSLLGLHQNEINNKDSDGNTILHRAIGATMPKQEGGFKFFFNTVNNIEIMNKSMNLLLHFLRENNLEKLVNEQNNNGETPLLIAVKNNQFIHARNLVNAYADATIADHSQLRPLDYVDKITNETDKNQMRELLEVRALALKKAKEDEKNETTQANKLLTPRSPK